MIRTRLPRLVALATLVAALPLSAQNARPGTLLGEAERTAVAAGTEVTAVLLLDTADVVSVSVSDDCATDWSAPIQVDDDATGAAKSIDDSSVQTVGSYVFAAWLDARDGTNSVWFNHSIDGGATWNRAQRIDDGTVPGAGDVRGFRMGVTAGPATPNVYFLIRLRTPGGADEQLHAVANDGTSVTTFLPAVVVPSVGPQAGSVNAIDLAADGDTWHVAFEDDRLGNKEVWYQRSDDRGQTWLASDVQLTDLNDQDGDSDAPVRITSNGTTVAVAWEERALVASNPEVRAAVSTDGGATFGAGLKVGTYDATVPATTPSVIAYDDGNVSVGWQDARTGTTSLYVATSSDAGATWGTDTLLSPSGGTRIRMQGAGTLGVGAWVSGAALAKSQTAYTVDSGATWKTFLVSAETVSVLTTAFDLNPLAGNFGTSPNVVTAWTRDDDPNASAVVGGYSPCGPATLVSRNAGINPDSFSGTPPVLGETWDTTVDLSTTGHPFAFIMGFEQPLETTLPNGYTLLVNVLSNRGELLSSPVVAGPTANFSIPIPNDPCICEFDFYAQAVHFNNGQDYALSNALDGVINGF